MSTNEEPSDSAPVAPASPLLKPSPAVPVGAPTTTSSIPPNKQLTLASAIDATLHFFATASNETLGVCAVGLCASTYLVLGRVGLVLMGAVGGIVLHATWESHVSGDRDAASNDITRRRKELGVEVARRVLDWRDRAPKGLPEDAVDGDGDGEVVVSPNARDYSDFPPEVDAALMTLTDAVIRDYVKWWYSPIMPKDKSFPDSCRQCLVSFIRSMSNHLSRKRTADPFLDFVANSTSIIIIFLEELSAALKASPNQTPDIAIREYLKYEPQSSLANVLSIDQQQRKLNLVADDILQNFLRRQEYNSPPVKTFLREVMASLVLESTVLLCSKPEWINGWIVYLLQEGEPEIMNVIDEGVQNMTGKLTDAKSSAEARRHERRMSKAEEAMEEAMREVQRMNEMIAEEEAKRKKLPAAEQEDTSSVSTVDVALATPTSSEDARPGSRSLDSSMLLDIEGNHVPLGQPSPAKEASSFTSFDQLGDVGTVPNTTTPPMATEIIPLPPPLTLHNASISIMDLGDYDQRISFKQKPNGEYLVQIEPASQRYPGWMVTRKYADFEPLHETLLVLARLSGYAEFSVQYPTLPTYKGQTPGAIVQSLEKYLRFALKSEGLAESESMRKFLDKAIGLEKVPAQSKNVLMQGSAALENVGKGFINVLGQGGKNIAGGGKAVLGGVQGVFGAVAKEVGGGQRKSLPASRSQLSISKSETSTSSFRYSQDISRDSSESLETRPTLPSRPSMTSSGFSSPSPQNNVQASLSQETLDFPPPPSEMSDDYAPLAASTTGVPETPPRQRQDTVTATNPPAPDPALPPAPSESPTPVPAAKPPSRKAKPPQLPLNEEETRATVELIFAILMELYSLAGTWTIRLSLLTAAKTYLLRPANPQLESIRVLLQESVLDANFSAKGLAAHIYKLRENALPTQEELEKWPKELSAEEKEKLRLKARKLLVERGMPTALTGLMGQAASGEALGKVFDCLQVGQVSRGLMFALMLQGIRAVTQ